MRALSARVSSLVRAAASADAAAVQAAADGLSTADVERADDLLEHVVRALLEDTHLDGLSGDDVALVLDGCFERAAGWFPDVDPGVLVIVLTGALGILDPEEDEPVPPTPLTVALHAALVVADLLAVGGHDLTALDAYLDRALAELHRAQTVEMP